MSGGSWFDYEAWDVDNVNLSFVTVDDLRQLLAVRHPNFMSNIYKESARLDSKLLQDLKSIPSSRGPNSTESTTISTISSIISSITPSIIYPTATSTTPKTSSTLSSSIPSSIPSTLSTSSISPSTISSYPDASEENSSSIINVSPISPLFSPNSTSPPVTLSLGILQIPSQHLPIYIGAITGILILVFLIILFIIITLKKSRKNISRGKLRSYHISNENDSSSCDDKSRFVVNINQSQNKRLETVIQLNGNPENSSSVRHELVTPQILSPKFSPILSGFDNRHQMTQEISSSPPLSGYIGRLESFSKPSHDNSQHHLSQDDFISPANNLNNCILDGTTPTFSTFQTDPHPNKQVPDQQTTEQTPGTPADWDEGIESEDDIDADAFKKKILASVVERGVISNSLVSSVVEKEDLYAKINYEAKYKDRGESRSPTHSMGSDGNSPIVTPPAPSAPVAPSARMLNNNIGLSLPLNNHLQDFDESKIVVYGTIKATSFDGSESECLI